MGKLGALFGTVALAGVGGLVGGLFTAGAFSTVGASAGVMLGGVVFAQPQAAGFSSVRDLKANVADPAMLPIVCGGDIDDPSLPGGKLDGGVWLPGKIIKVAPNGGISTRRVDSGDGGGGTGGKLFGRPTGTDAEEHFLSVAIAWCEGSLEHPQRLLELIADDEVIYKWDALENEDGYIEMTPVLDSLGNEVGIQSDNFRHYYGTETQLPDDVVQTWYVDENGAQLGAPAFRGTSYTVLLNYQIDKFGHIPQLYGRMSNGVIERIEQCRFFLLRANGLDGETVIQPSAIQLSKITGQSRGWYMTQKQSPRSIGELVASRSNCALVEHSYNIYDVDLADPVIHTLEDWETGAGEGAEGEQPTRFKSAVDDKTKLPSRVEVRYSDIRKRDENMVPASMPTAQHENVQTFDLPTVDTEEEIWIWAHVQLDAAYVAATPGEVATLPRRIKATPGDVLRVPRKGRPGEYHDLLIRSRNADCPGAITFQGASWSKDSYGNIPTIVPTPRPVQPNTWATPLVFVCNSVCLDASMLGEGGVVIAASQTPNNKFDAGIVVDVDRLDGAVWTEINSSTFPVKARMGYLTEDWIPPSPYRGYVDDSPLSVAMYHGALVTGEEVKVRGGANFLLLENGVGVSFIVSQQTGLTEYGTGIYELGPLKGGRWTSEDLVTGPVPAGTRCVLVTDETGARLGGVQFRALNASLLNKQLRLRAAHPEKAAARALREFIFTGTNMQEPSPTGVRARRDGDALVLQGRARTRMVDDGAWNLPIAGRLTAPRFGAGYKYRVTLSDGVLSVNQDRYATDDNATFNFEIAGPELETIFGEVPETLSGSVALYGVWGVGRARTWEQE